MKKIEKRTYIASGMEAREDNGALKLSGYAAKFDSASNPLPFIETIQRGAFTKTLSESPDVRLLINHDGLPLARTKSGTLKLWEDEIGLYFEAELPDTQEARDLHTLVARGDVDQCSFSFRVVRQEWSQDRQNRKLIEVSLRDGDVSLVTYPAYSETSAEARNMTDKVTELLAQFESYKTSRAMDNLSAKQLAFDKAVEGIAELLVIESGELKTGENEVFSLEMLLEALEGLMTWRVGEYWEDEMPAVPADEVPMEASSISLRYAQAIASRL